MDERVIPGETNVVNLQKHIARYNLALQYAQHKQVLDIACGTGYGSNLLSYVADSVTGVDQDPLAIQIAKDSYDRTNIHFKTEDFYRQYGQYEFVVCFETIEHLKDLEKTQNKVIEWLKPGGFILFSVPLHEEDGYNPYHHHQFDIDGAKELFSELKPVGEIFQVGCNFYPIDGQGSKRSNYYLAVKQLN